MTSQRALEEVAQALESALLATPERDDLRLELGSNLLRLNRLEEALACFDLCGPEALRPALFGRAVALQRLGRFEAAERSYERLLTLDPAAEEALSNLIAMHVELFNLGRVEHYSRMLRGINPHSPAAIKGLALVAIERREYKSAAFYCTLIPEQDAGESHGSPESDGDSGIEYRLSWKIASKLRQAVAPPTGI